MMTPKVLIVGGAGFIGSRLARKHPSWDVLDLKNGQDVRREGIKNYYDVIILLAAHLGMDVEEDYAHNLEIYSSLVRSYPDRQKPLIIFTSSAAVYNKNYRYHSEIEELDPSTLYGKSKKVGEEILSTIFPTVIFRLSNVFGDGDGKGVIDRFKNGINTIYGDGLQVRDYIYVEKVVSAISKVVANPVKYIGETYNISTGKGQTVLDVFEHFALGKPKYLPKRDFDVDKSVLSNVLAREDGLV